MVYTYHTIDSTYIHICIYRETMCIYICIDTYLDLYRYRDIYIDIDIETPVSISVRPESAQRK